MTTRENIDAPANEQVQQGPSHGPAKALTSGQPEQHGGEARACRVNEIHPQLPERLREKIRIKDGCWIWTAHLDRHGYGKARLNGKQCLAHRVVYTLLIGDIPSGLTLDHLCRVTFCVNPSHLEPVSAGENTLRGFGPSAINKRKTHCKRGHLFDDANTHQRRGKRWCKACCRERNRACYRKRTERSRAR